MGRHIDVFQVHQNTEPWTDLMVCQWISSGIFPRIQYVAAQSRGQRFTVEIERNTRDIYRTDHLHVDVQRHFMEISRDNQKECESNAQLVSPYARDSEQDNGHSCGLDQRKVVFYQ